jgi:hypothetical protein
MIVSYSALYVFLQQRVLHVIALLGHVKTSFILITSGLFLTPVIHTLTKPTSSDTLVLFILILLITHLLSYDYAHIDDKEPNSTRSPLSFNAIVIAGILMGSRLQRLSHVFYLILFVTM